MIKKVKDKFWNEQAECMNIKARRSFQADCLARIFKKVYEKVPFYRKQFTETGQASQNIKIKSVDFISSLPFFTSKDDLRNNYPFGLCAVSKNEIARVHLSSGTSGKPVFGFYTRNDLASWTECVARGLWAAGIRPYDVIQNSYGIGLSTGGLGFVHGADKLGCAVIPAGSGLAERQIRLFFELKPTVLFCTPSFALTIIEKAEQIGVNLKKLPLKIGIFGAEPWSGKIRLIIEEKMKIKAYDGYGLTEFMGPGVAFACSCSENKLHINEDYFFPEIIDPESGRVLNYGNEGELVITSLQQEAAPLIRYRTGDITTLCSGKCGCGRTLTRMERVMRRFDDMKTFNGIKFYPLQVENAILSCNGVMPFYQIILQKKENIDFMIVEIEINPKLYRLSKEADRLKNTVSKNIKKELGIDAEVRILNPGTLKRSESKIQRLIDKRR